MGHHTLTHIQAYRLSGLTVPQDHARPQLYQETTLVTPPNQTKTDHRKHTHTHTHTHTHKQRKRTWSDQHSHKAIKHQNFDL